MKTFLRIAAVGLAASGLTWIGTASAADNAATMPFTAVYTVSKSGLPLGQAHFGLKKAKRDGCYVYAGHARPNALVQMFLGNIDDETRFCVVDGQIRPQHFRHHIDGKPDDSYTLDFDWSAMTVQYKNGNGDSQSYPLKRGAQDPMSLQIAARHWLASSDNANGLPEDHEFTLVDDDGLEPYRVNISDAGKLKTPGGSFDAVKLTRRGDHSHALTFWLARDAGWIPVQVRRLDDGDTRYTLTVQSLSRGGASGK